MSLKLSKYYIVPFRDGTGFPVRGTQGHRAVGSAIFAGSGRVGSRASMSDPVIDDF